jgi:hypothetical protein
LLAASKKDPVLAFKKWQAGLSESGGTGSGEGSSSRLQFGASAPTKLFRDLIHTSELVDFVPQLESCLTKEALKETEDRQKKHKDALTDLYNNCKSRLAKLVTAIENINKDKGKAKTPKTVAAKKSSADKSRNQASGSVDHVDEAALTSEMCEHVTKVDATPMPPLGEDIKIENMA